ncbi:hypothetical protein [Thermoanaerobaculum aquaticum]|uniref:hypothetical protein n=1 Tax=Thermoanaerobaculum aquaticum TaxID=1312852 RepID=UPI0013784F07|nr:hypothetical protein [Thermoanaerobaculum aquaticum]
MRVVIPDLVSVTTLSFQKLLSTAGHSWGGTQTLTESPITFLTTAKRLGLKYRNLYS